MSRQNCYSSSGFVPKDVAYTSVNSKEAQIQKINTNCLASQNATIGSLTVNAINVIDTLNARCIQNETTSVCTDSTGIQFTTSGTERGRFDSNGAFVVGAANATPGKIAHFEGDIKVTGVIDPTALQVEQSAAVPVDPTASTTGVVWIRNDSPNVLVYTDNAGTDTILGGGGIPTDWTPTESSIVGSVPWAILRQGVGVFTNTVATSSIPATIITTATNSCPFTTTEQYLPVSLPAGLPNGTGIFLTYADFSSFPPSIAFGISCNVAAGIYNISLMTAAGAVGAPVGPVAVLSTDEISLSVRDTLGATAELKLYVNGVNVLTYNPTAMVATPNCFGIYYAGITSSVSITKPNTPTFPLGGGQVLYSTVIPSGFIDPASYPANRAKKTFSLVGMATPLNSSIGLVDNGDFFIFDASGNPLSKEYTNIQYLDGATSNLQNQIDTITSTYIPQSDIGITVQPFTKNTFGSASDPTVTDDNTLNYSIGSQWVNTATDNFFFCADATTGAAMWKQTMSTIDVQIAIQNRLKMVSLNGVGGTLFNSPSISPTNGPYFLLNSVVPPFDGWGFTDNTVGAQSWVTIGTKVGPIYLMQGAFPGNWWHMVAGVLTDTGSQQYSTGPEGTYYHIYSTGSRAVVEEIAVLP